MTTITSHWFAGKKVTVMGLGVHGGAIGNIRWLHQQGAKITVTDLKNESDLATSVAAIKHLPHLELVLGRHRVDDFRHTDMVLSNPAVPRAAKYLSLARASGVPIEMDSSLFFKLAGRDNIIGVTGSKGKTTTTTAIAHLLRVKHTGTENSSPLETIPSRYGQKVVFELSSWRLEALAEQNISPATAVITSIYRDHLNTYPSFKHYRQVKKSILRYQQPADTALLNFDDQTVANWSDDVVGRTAKFSLLKQLSKDQDGIFIRHEQIMVNFNGQSTAILPLDTLPLSYPHQVRNLLPAIYLAVTAGFNPNIIRTRLKQIRPLPHRLENAGTYNNVQFINDSAATMPDATIAAISALKGHPLIHILGGNDKNLSWTPWAETETAANIKALVWLPGDATSLMKEAYRQAGGAAASYNADNMANAVQQAVRLAKSGDTVLLSPAATSFGLFKHEFDRGDQFRQAVRELLAANNV